MKQPKTEPAKTTEPATTPKPHRSTEKQKVVAPGVRSNPKRSPSHRFEAVAHFYVGAFPSIAAATKARDAFRAKVQKLRAGANQ